MCPIPVNSRGVDPYPDIPKPEFPKVTPGSFKYEGDGFELSLLEAEGGACIVSYSGAVPCVELPSVVNGLQVVAICRNCFSKIGGIDTIILPEGLTFIASEAFTLCSVSEVVFPSTLKTIADHAFFRCHNIRNLQLNDGLEYIGTEAFHMTSVAEVRIPSSVKYIGRQAFAHSPAIFSWPTLVIDNDNSHFIFDEQGALYRRTDEGLFLIELINLSTTKLELPVDCIAIANAACLKQPKITTLVLNEGLRNIGDVAFQECRALTTIEPCETLEIIGYQAFYATAITSFYFPACFKAMGNMALITAKRDLKPSPTTLTDIQVNPECKNFYMSKGMLCQRIEGDRSAVLVYAGPNKEIDFPDEVTHIEPFAFAGVANITRVRFHDHMFYIDPTSFAVRDAIDVIELVEKDGTVIRAPFPGDVQGKDMMARALCRGCIEAQRLITNSDNAICMSQDEYYRVSHAAYRLAHPERLEHSLMQRMTVQLSSDISRTCMIFAEHHDREGFLNLIEAGVLNADNIDVAFEEVNKTDNTDITGWLLEVKRRQGWSGGLSGFDI